MSQALARREFLSCIASAAALGAVVRPAGILIDTHIHLFAEDQERFPYHANATYRPPAADLEDYKVFVRESKIDHAVIVHPEPYQDDHRYLEYCFAHEPSPGFFKGTCLFDPIAEETPARMEELVRENPGRIVALRIHEMRGRGALLQHGALPLEGDIARVCRFLVPAGDPRRVRSRATTLDGALGRQIPWERAAATVAEGVAGALNVHLQPGRLTPGEQVAARQLLEEKYASQTWTARS